MTVEAAIALGTIIAVVVLCLAALLAASAQVRCVDAAREAARLSARGADTAALPAARRVAPPGATIALHDDNDNVVASVTTRVPLLPLLVLRAEAVAVREPGVRE
ncbi:TadE family type IV pilus minor pilin [Nocardia sp. NPDC004068]|uniref:TadE family type IV pilus minor pilin n=1 Tax=Nocardia sp. NPDC004068 TaxID=3364303 RepID=UPI0036A3B96A